MKAILKTRISCLGCVLLALALLGLGHLIATPAAPHPWYGGFEKPIILAHQGGMEEWPSCTMYAFRRAREIGSDVLDLDLQMTRDGVLVLMHDTTVNRTTDGTGAVAEMTWEELKKLDAAYNFTVDAKSFHLRGKGIGVPRLIDVLEEFPDWKLQIEVKKAPLSLAKKLSEVLKEYQAEEKILLSCFDENMMAELRRQCPGVATSATPSEIRFFTLAAFCHLEGVISPKYSSLQVPLRASGWSLVTPRTVAAARSRGLKVIPWTIDSEADVEVCRQAGVDGFNTTFPTKMERVRENWLKPGEPLFSVEGE